MLTLMEALGALLLVHQQQTRQLKLTGPIWSKMALDGGLIFSIFDLVDLGLYNTSDPVHVECIRLCFVKILRGELYEVTELWNQHNISPSKFGNSSGPRGKPDCMYFLPHLYNTVDYSVHVDSTDIDEFINDSMSVEDVSNKFLEFATIITNHLSLQKPSNAKEGLDLYYRRWANYHIGL